MLIVSGRLRRRPRASGGGGGLLSIFYAARFFFLFAEPELAAKLKLSKSDWLASSGVFQLGLVGRS